MAYTHKEIQNFLYNPQSNLLKKNKLLDKEKGSTLKIKAKTSETIQPSRKHTIEREKTRWKRYT